MAQAAQPHVPTGIWKDGSTLIVGRMAQMPPQCIRCGAPATQTLPIKYGWLKPFHYVWILFGALPFVIVAMIVMKRMTIALPLCDAHRQQRKSRLTLGWVLALLGFVFMFLPLALADSNPGLAGLGFLLGLAAFFAGIIIVSLASKLIRPSFIGKDYGAFIKVSPQFLAAVAALPPGSSYRY
ncbi:MAG: hypothetical protein ACRD50_07480 [Candidatus Acidiferrales bacterium]